MHSGALTLQEVEELVGAVSRKLAQRKEAASSPGPARGGGLETAALVSAAAPAVRLSRHVQALARLMDHTLLRPQAKEADIALACEQAREWGFQTVCVNPAWVPLAAERLRGSEVKVATVAGFPLGASATVAKRAEAETAIRDGAQEIDMVMNIGAMKSGDFIRVENDIRGVIEICRPAGVTLKVILENAYLSDEEKVAACRLAQRAGADFVKTSTGFAPSGATEADVRLMRRTVGPAMGVKAAGGIRTLEAALRLIEAGASRLGLSAGVSVLMEAAQLLE